MGASNLEIGGGGGGKGHVINYRGLFFAFEESPFDNWDSADSFRNIQRESAKVQQKFIETQIQDMQNSRSSFTFNGYM